jgi:hypothetical protein
LNCELLSVFDDMFTTEGLSTSTACQYTTVFVT